MNRIALTSLALCAALLSGPLPAASQTSFPRTQPSEAAQKALDARVRVDAAQTLTAAQKTQAQSNIGLPTGAWTAYAPVVTPASGTITTPGTIQGWYQVTGKRVDVNINVNITTNGTASGYLFVGLPLPAARATFIPGGEQNVTGKALRPIVAAGASTLVVVNYDNTYPGVNGALLVISGSYQTP
ncbi:hypothetical protein BK022_03615 [Methylorubrum extorquens]|uniref:Uncharacterized protein n=1 Tax=Methylorubrum extorquens TaxID=408 RepID=A0A1S1P9T9_METEX|nr:hypothetical protein BK022_03615 [Methylorubrum extorquens]